MALVFDTSKLRHYLQNAKIHVITKFEHLKHLFDKTDLSEHLAKLIMFLTEFDLKFFSQKEIKGQALTNHLVDAPSPLTSPNMDSFLDESVLINI